MKVTENVEKGGAVLKMVSSSTGFIKGMMELGLAAAGTNTSHVSDGSPADTEDDNDASPTSHRPANGPPSLVQSSTGPELPNGRDGGGDQAAASSRRLVKGLTWLRRRCRRAGGGPPSSSEQLLHRNGWRGRTTNNGTTGACSTAVAAGKVIPSRDVNHVDRSPVPDASTERTTTVCDNDNNNDEVESAVEGLYEKRSKWLKRCGRMADDVNVLNDESSTAVEVGCSSRCQDDAPSYSAYSEKQAGVAISVISDLCTSDRAESPAGSVNAGSAARLSEGGGTVIDRHGGGLEAVEVVLDPAALKTPHGTSDDQFRHVPSVTTAYSPTRQPLPLQSDMGHSVTDRPSAQDVASMQQSPVSRVQFESSVTDHTEESEASPSLSSDVDVLCSEIGRLVADYMRQHLVYTSAIYLFNKDYFRL